MSFLAGRRHIVGAVLLRRHVTQISRLATAAEQTQLGGENAYEILGVIKKSSFNEIKASFRKLAKETHPDLVKSVDSNRFIQILAAYEILSDNQKRASYDRYLSSQKVHVRSRKSSVQASVMNTYESSISTTNQMDVVEWLRWYRHAVHSILSEKRVVSGTGYLDELERDFYSAINAAYYGPLVESLDVLPDCFEAEERSSYETDEILHLVSGRDLFGIVKLADKIPKLSSFCHKELIPFSNLENSSWIPSNGNEYHENDAYRDIELHLSGKVVAVANRIPPKSNFNGITNDDLEDHIHVFLSSDEDLEYDGEEFLKASVGVQIGRISGLGTSSDEGSCFVYDCHGEKTHVIMKHRTLMVKHMHWYEVGDKVSVCECRCTKARLPPSRYWLFEPRCGMHDVGGWYVETYGKDRKGRTIPSKRFWDGFDEHFEKRLHPAIYLLALAYRTLDLEDAKRRKQRRRDVIRGKLFGLIDWYKNYV